MVDQYRETRFPGYAEYALRLVFDKSPYRHRVQDGCPWRRIRSANEDPYYCAEYKEFVSYEIEGWGVGRCIVI